MTKKNKAIDKPHDSVFKQGMRDIRVARDMFNHYFPDEIKKIVQLDTLELTNNSYITDEYRHLYSDIVYKVQTEAGAGYVYLLHEHQSKPDKRLVLRVPEYSLRIMEDHLDQGHDKLPLVVPVIFYNGTETPYPYSTDIFDYFDNRELAEQVMFKPIKLIDVNQIPDKQLMAHHWSGYMELLLKYMKKKQDFLKIFKAYIEQGGVSYLIRHNGQQYAIDMIYLMVKEADIQDKEMLISLLESESTELGGKVMTLLQAERQEGMQQGMQQGMQKQAINMARKMLLDKQPITMIAKFTGLSSAEIQRIKN